MGLFQEDRRVLKIGPFLHLVKLSLALYSYLFIINMVGALVLLQNMVWGIFTLLVLPGIIITIVYHKALWSGIDRYELDTYKRKVSYLSILTLLVILYGLSVNYIMTRKFEVPGMVVIAVVIIVSLGVIYVRATRKHGSVKVIMPLLKGDEKVVVDILNKHEGSVNQRLIVRESDDAHPCLLHSKIGHTTCGGGRIGLERVARHR